MKNGESNIAVTKASGNIEPFSIKKLRSSLARAQATTDEINSIIETLLPKLLEQQKQINVTSNEINHK